MFAINQYNEGVHAPGVDGVILGRTTSSDIVFFEQIGRALSVKENTKEKYEEYQNLSRSELLEIAQSQSIEVTSNMTKDEIIERLLSPVIIDLTNNVEFVEELENNLKSRVREVQKSLSHSKRKIMIRDLDFDIMVENRDLFEILRYVEDRVNPDIWKLKYQLAQNYYNKNKHLEILRYFKTLNGIDYNENGYNLGIWISEQRQSYKEGTLTKERYELLKAIGMRFESKQIKTPWEEMYKLAVKYYNKYGNLKVPKSFRTLDGITNDKFGYPLGTWLSTQRQLYRKEKLSEERKSLLKKINLNADINMRIVGWDKMYALAEIYFKEYGNLEANRYFKTLNGIDYNENGYALGAWFATQRTLFKANKLPSERKILLEKLNMRFENKRTTISWEETYQLAVNFYNHNHHLNVIQTFKTLDGFTKDKNGYSLGLWITNQRHLYKTGKLEPEKAKLLDSIGMIWIKQTNADQKQKFCTEYQIPYAEVKNISYKELYAKTMYILDNGMLVSMNGVLNPIYNMSSNNIAINYGITLRKLIKQYKEKEKEK